MTLDKYSIDTDPFHNVHPSVYAIVIDWPSIRAVLYTLSSIKST
jgi:hypothetical protein